MVFFWVLSWMAQGSRQCQNSEGKSKMGSHIKVTESYSPWRNAAEGAIKEFKKGTGRKNGQDAGTSQVV